MGLDVQPGRIAGMLEEFRDGYERNLQKKGERA